MPSIFAPVETLLQEGHLDGVYAISDAEFQAVRKLIYREAGIALSEAKRALVCSRLARRLRDLGLGSHGEYLDYLATCDPQGVERQLMINALTTNKTDFFREPHHFAFLREHVFPQVHRNAALGRPRRLRIWSAACSMGDEPYSIAMTILDHFGSLRGWDIRILASDVNTAVLDTAERGIYPLERLSMLDEQTLQRFFVRGERGWADHCRVRPELRRLVTFRHINFMDDPWPIRAQFDVIFCRNVIIYFDQETQRRLLPRLAEHLLPEGYLILGHSENIQWLGDHFTPLGNTIYQRHRKSGHVQAPTPRAIRPYGSLNGHFSNGPRREIVAGEFFATREPTEISTVLGSCVAACLFDPLSRVGGMTHFLLPYQVLDDQVSARYGIHALELLINEIMQHGGDRRRLRAKVFGGANVLSFPNAAESVGAMNAQFIRHFLRTEQIPIDAECLGGKDAIRVHFCSHNGKAYAKRIAMSGNLVHREQRYAHLAAARIQNESRRSVTLF